MIQDIAPQVMDNQFREVGAEEVRAEDTVFVFDGREIVCRVEETGEVIFPAAGELLTAGAAREDLRYLFSIREPQNRTGENYETAAERHYWLYANDDAEAVVRMIAALGSGENAASEGTSDSDTGAAGYHKETIRVLRRTSPKAECYAAETAWHLYGWYRDNRYCGRCGHPTTYSHAERAMICPSCGNTIYPKIVPAVIVGILNPDRTKIVMTQYAGRAYKGHALVAGFCEIGETAEDTVRREVLEEVGLHVRDIRYYKSQPWGFDSDLLLGYYCTADEDEPIHMDDGELARAVWVSRDEIGEEPADLSLTATMIMHFKEGMNAF